MSGAWYGNGTVGNQEWFAGFPSFANSYDQFCSPFWHPENGWVTAVRVYAGGEGVNAELATVVWGFDGAFNPADVIGRSNNFIVGPGVAWREAQMIAPVRIVANWVFYAGYWKGHAQAVRHGYGGGSDRRFDITSGTAGPVTFSQDTSFSGALSVQYYFRPNAAPGKPAWAGSTPSGITTLTNPVFQGTMPHPNGDGDLDLTDWVEVQIWDVTNAPNNQLVYHNSFTVTAEERAQGYWSRQIYVHTPGRTYHAYFKHRDSWGVWSPLSDGIAYTVSGGPHGPTLSAPVGGAKLTTLTPTYQGNYTHVNGLSANLINIELYNADGTVLLSSKELGVSVAHGANWSVSHSTLGLPTLSWGTGYQWRARLRDSVSVWGPFSGKSSFKTNGAPNTPSNVSPSGGQTLTAPAVLRAPVSDPDGDTITQVTWDLWNVTDNVQVAGYPATQSVNVPSGSQVSRDVTSALTLGKQYQWRIQASDGSLWGTWTAWQVFIYSQVPAVFVDHVGDVVVQDTANRANADVLGDAEVGGAWTEQAGDIDVSGNAFVPATLAGGAAIATISGVADGVIKADVSLGADGALRSTGVIFRWSDLNNYWQARIQKSADGTQQVVELLKRQGGTFSSVASASITLTANITYTLKVVFAGDRIRIAVDGTQHIDVGGQTFNQSATTVGFEFRHTVVSGAQVDSFYLYDLPQYSVVTTPAMPIEITYDGDAAKAADRTVVERQDGSTWVQVYDSGYVQRAATAWTLPIGVLANNQTYRLTVWTRDANSLGGQAQPVQFSTAWTPPDPLNILIAQGEPESASILLQWEASQLPASAFIAIEVQREAAGEPPETVAIIRDPAATVYRYHYPASGRAYTFRVRQIRLEATGETVPSEWSETAGIVVDFGPVWFLKPIDQPFLPVRFLPVQESLPEETIQGDNEASRGWGEARPVHDVGDGTWATIGLRIDLWDDGSDMVPPAERLGRLRRMKREMPVIALLRQHPPDKQFVKVDQISWTPDGLDGWVVNLSLTETAYVEDAYQQGEVL